MINALPNLPMRTANLFADSNVGLYELDDDGTVLYCRTGNARQSGETLTTAGRNFFYEVAPFENMDELRRHFKNFVKSRSTVENLRFSVRVKNLDIPVKVLLTRVIQRFNSERSDTTIVDIRKI